MSKLHRPHETFLHNLKNPKFYHLTHWLAIAYIDLVSHRWLQVYTAATQSCSKTETAEHMVWKWSVDVKETAAESLRQQRCTHSLTSSAPSMTQCKRLLLCCGEKKSHNPLDRAYWISTSAGPVLKKRNTITITITIIIQIIQIITSLVAYSLVVWKIYSGQRCDRRTVGNMDNLIPV